MRHSNGPRRQARVRLRRSAVALAVLCFASATPLPAQQFRAAWADVFRVGLRSTSEVNTMISKLVAGRYNAVGVQALAYMDNGSGSSGTDSRPSTFDFAPRPSDLRPYPTPPATPKPPS
jgi:GH24 family phage-related lysozyme (muramidase)